MGCVQAKAAAPVPAKPSAEASEKLPTLLSKTQPAISKVGQSITKSAVGGVTAAGHGAAGAATAVGNGIQQVGGGAAGALGKAGQGAKGAVFCLGDGLTGPSSEPTAKTKVEKTWYERLLSFDPLACCCQPPADGNMLGSLVKSMLSNFDSSSLGVKVELGTLLIDPAIGRIQVRGLTVRNPEGWRSEYLLHADKIIVDFEMEKLLYSFGKELHVEELVFDGIDVIYEKGLTSSNLHDLLEHLDSGAAEAEQATTSDVRSAGVKTEPASHCRQSQWCCRVRTDKEPEAKLLLHTVRAQSIGAKLATKLTQDHGLRLEVGDLKYDDFETEMGAGRGLIDIIRILVTTLVKSVLATVVGKGNTEAIACAANAVKDKLTSLERGSVEAARKGCSKIC